MGWGRDRKRERERESRTWFICIQGLFNLGFNCRNIKYSIVGVEDAKALRLSRNSFSLALTFSFPFLSNAQNAIRGLLIIIKCQTRSLFLLSLHLCGFGSGIPPL
jgi:hypothetical protein